MFPNAQTSSPTIARSLILSFKKPRCLIMESLTPLVKPYGARSRLASVDVMGIIGWHHPSRQTRLRRVRDPKGRSLVSVEASPPGCVDTFWDSIWGCLGVFASELVCNNNGWLISGWGSG
jgi:hypothetical protein